MSCRYLALDLGAESGRSMLAELADHKLSLTELHRFANIPVRLPNGLYWDTFRLYYDICEGIRASAKVTDRLDGIAVDTWGVDFGLIASDGSLIECPRHYRDARTQGTLEQVFAKVPRAEIFRQTGIQFMEINSLYQIFALQRDSPGALANARKLLFMPDLFNYFLTGAYACERTIASTSQFYDPVKRGFATDTLRKLGISGSFFAELVDPGAQLGPLLRQVVEHCGLKHDAMVYATGSHDTASAVAATPALDDSHWCYISSGTWSLMGVETDKPVINDASLAANFTNESGVGGKIRLLKNIAGLWILQECRRAWARAGQEYTYAELMERAAAAKPTETIIDPDDFVLPGNHPERICEFCRKSGQEIPADAGSMALVILQSLAVRYKEVLEVLERLTGRSITTIHIVGGGSRNRLLNQLAANRTGRKIIAGPVEATAAGNALTQAMGSGDVSSLQDLRSIVRRSFEVEEFLPA
ncbi:MAG TPA: rhamnulokinase family protein [Bryobacteraceae bacterium]|nr:rhamnulokinase family protein [Bryobacteraceae bacterium]